MKKEEIKQITLSYSELLRILDALNIGVIYVDENGVIRYANKLAEEIRRMDRSERIGTHVVGCHPGSTHERVKKVLEEFKEGIINHRHKMIRVGKNYFDNQYISIKDENGNYKGILLTSQDVTEKVNLQKKLEEHYRNVEAEIKSKLAEIESKYQELMELQAQLIYAEKMASLGQFVSIIAHEVNNPLDGIQNCLYAIFEDPENIEQTRRYTKLALESLNKIESVIRSLLEYARPHDYCMEKLNLKESIEDTLNLIRYKAEKYEIEIENLVGSDIFIKGSRHHISQVFLNIIFNSIDAIIEKKLKGLSDYKGKIKIEATDNDKSVCVRIIDNGCGIPQENINKIFSPFFTTKKDKGTGLGLYICYNIVYIHGGNISVESKVMEGTTFSICLPKYSEFSPITDSSVYEKLIEGRKILKNLIGR